MKPQIASSLFPATRTELKAASPKKAKPTSNTSKRRSESTAPVRKSSDEFYDDGLDDDDLFDVPLRDLEFDHIENYANPNNEVTRRNTVKNAAVSSRNEPARKKSAEENDGDEPKQLKNGKWACNHKCKDRTACKHMCCREGLDKPPAPKKPAKKSEVATDRTTQHTPIKESIQTKLQLTASKRKSSAGIQVLDLTRPDKKMKPDYAKDGPREFRKLDLLHRKVQKTSPPVSLSNITHTKPAYCYSAGGDHTLSFMESNAGSERVSTAVSTDYGDILSDGPAHFEDDLMLKEPDAYNKERYKSTHIAHHDTPVREILSGRDSENYSDDDSLLADAMIGLTDSQEIQNPSFRKVEDFQSAYDDNSFDLDDDLYNLIDQNTSVHARTQSPAKTMEHADISGEESTSTMKPRSQKNTPISSPHFNGSKQRRTTKDFVSAKNMVSNAVLRELKQSRNQVSSASISENALRSAKGKENSEPPTMESAASRGNEEEAGDVGPAPDPRLKDFKPWFLAEFGDIVELVDE